MQSMASSTFNVSNNEARNDDLIPAARIDDTFRSTTIDLISASLPSRILYTSDEFFAPASSLINPAAPVHRPGVFVSTGAWYDGWETRRHNPAPYDCVIVRLGVASGIVRGVEIDTAFFNGNEAPAISVEGCFDTNEGADERVKTMSEEGWKETLGARACGPNRRHAWQVLPTAPVTHVRLRMYPDGGIARFRLYGTAVPVWPLSPKIEVELSAAVMGGVAVACSDEHFGRAGNLLLPGRGKDMGDGWETKRSRVKDHTDWVVVRLGGRGKVERCVVDTRHFIGNFPASVVIEGCDVTLEADWKSAEWVPVLTKRKLAPDDEFTFDKDLINVIARDFTHMKLTMIPDGGVKRFRVFGTRASD